MTQNENDPAEELSAAILEQSLNVPKIELRPDDVQSGLGKLVLVLLNLIHELLERQAFRRIEHGDLSDEQIEKLGITLKQQAEEIDRIRETLKLKPEDLNLDLGPLGKLI